MSASPGVRCAAVPADGPTAASSRLPALTGLRGVAALLVVGTHAAFATGYLNHPYLGAVYARLEIGVAVFFVLSGFLLFRPWVRAAADGEASPSLSRFARHRVRRIVPAYAVTVVATFEIYTVFTPGPNPGQTWQGILRYLTFTQIYTADYLTTMLHPGLSQMWSMAVEVAFYAALPALAYVLLGVVCRGLWRPRRGWTLRSRTAATSKKTTVHAGARRRRGPALGSAPDRPLLSSLGGRRRRARPGARSRGAPRWWSGPAVPWWSGRRRCGWALRRARS